MKYVKLFESWLNEAEEGDEGKLTSFNSARPQLWPVAKTTIGNLYNKSGDKLDATVLTSILSRAEQKTGEPFNPSPKLGFALSWGFVGIEDGGEDNKGRLKVRRGGQRATDTQTFKIDAKIQDRVFDVIFRGESDPIDYEEGDRSKMARCFLISKSAPEAGPAAFANYAYGDGNGECAIFLPNVMPNTGDGMSLNEDTIVTNCPVFVLADGKQYMTRIANLLMYINSGNITSFTEKSGSITDPKSPIGGIFAGEQAGAKASYAQTIRMPSGGNLAVGQDNANGLYKIGTGNIAKYLGQIKFDFDSDKLTDEAKQILDDDAVIGALTQADKTLIIVGHADGKVGKGGESYNVDLSKRRAKSVLAYLQTLPWFKKVSAKVTTNGVGSSQPVSPDNKGEDATAAAVNRRVEFLIDVPADTKPDYEAIKKAANLK